MSLKSDVAKARKPKPIPDGWRTSEQIANDDDCSVTTVQRDIKIVLKAGTWESQMWQQFNSAGQIRRIPIYRPKPKK